MRSNTRHFEGADVALYTGSTVFLCNITNKNLKHYHTVL